MPKYSGKSSELHWLPEHPELGRGPVRVDQFVEDRSVPRLQSCALYDTETDQRLYSGHQITLTTTDAGNHQLPDERLIALQWLLARVLRMSGAGEDLVTVYDDSPTVSPVASLVSSRTESPESLMESSAAPPPNSLSPKQSHQSSRSATVRFPKPKWLWKLAHRIDAVRGRQKLDPNNTARHGDALDGDALDGDVMVDSDGLVANPFAISSSSI
jgi:hypothetical protein